MDAVPPAPPPLSAQTLAPDLLTALLFRGLSDTPVHEALSIVLDTGLYRRDVGQYQLTGVSRVQPGGGTPLADAYGQTAKYMGQARTALFHQRPHSPPPSHPQALSVTVALLSPPAVVLVGEFREDTPQLRYLIGWGLAGAMPEHALVCALGEDALGTLLAAIESAFGPLGELPKNNAEVARLAQNLWQLVPPRADRRLRELCRDPTAMQVETALESTRQAMRRAGLVACGSLATAVAQVAGELRTSLDSYRHERDGLARLCSDQPIVADLVRLAVSTELADARWMPVSPTERRRGDGSQRAPR